MPEYGSLEDLQPAVTSSNADLGLINTLEEALSENSDANSYVSAPETHSKLAAKALEGMAKSNTLTDETLSKADASSPRTTFGSDSHSVDGGVVKK